MIPTREQLAEWRTHPDPTGTGVLLDTIDELVGVIRLVLATDTKAGYWTGTLTEDVVDEVRRVAAEYEGSGE